MPCMHPARARLAGRAICFSRRTGPPSDPIGLRRAIDNAHNHGTAQGAGKVGFIIAIIIIGFLVLLFLKPETFRTGVQVPVSVTVRGSVVGIGNVVQVRNTSDKTLTGVVVAGRNPGVNQSATYKINSLGPGQVAEVGWMEWSWRVAPDETITVVADNYLPIVFSSEQLGIRR
jgi:hypothetical protein